jgi:hypothetical protein
MRILKLTSEDSTNKYQRGCLRSQMAAEALSITGPKHFSSLGSLIRFSETI